MYGYKRKQASIDKLVCRVIKGKLSKYDNEEKNDDEKETGNTGSCRFF
jgi:hypothetical protein